MDDKLKELSKIYNDINIPDQLDQVIDEAINRGRSEVINMEKIKKRKSNKTAKWVRRVGATAASLVIVLGITVNASSVAAENIYKIPILGGIGKVITFREYKIDNDTSIGEVTVPKVDNVENKDIEKQINDMIMARVDALVEEQAKVDAEYKEAYLATGGTEEDYRKIETIVDYKKHFASDKILSFEIYKYQTLASAYNETFFYNMNLETGDNLTLKDVLGEDFVNITKETVEKEMLSRMEKEDIIYDVEYFKEVEITEDRDFYIQENGDIVVVFAKYEIASGAAGQQEFMLGNINQQ